MKNLFFWFPLLVLTSCSYFQNAETGRPKIDSLSLTEAQFRKDHLSNIQYDLKFNLSDKDNLKGSVDVRFDLKAKQNLNLDFTNGVVKSLIVNSQPVKEIRYNGFYIPIRSENLKEGVNTIQVEFTHPYSITGAGLYKYVDVEDGRTYLYSDFEPYDANKMFPCFDQPNLKALFTTEVIAPEKWQVVSTTRETLVEELGDLKRWVFPTSQLITTYAFALHAGEYDVWESTATTKAHEIPLRLFARKSMAKYVDPEEWFDLTRRGFTFFEDYFSYPYPYLKYDQLIVPDFNNGAMENVGAVTFSEDRFVQRSAKSRDEKRRLAGTLFHEMAHMWFGNLVTMNWWNDLWLNESFATYAGNLGVATATDFTETWAVFNRNSKQQAYQLDQSINTHPVVSESVSTDQASSQFDSITYAKGASVLKQLAYLIGDKAFRKGLKNYFTEHANGNTTLKDFMKVMEVASETDLKVWEERWLNTAMLNNIEVNYSCQKGKITTFEIYQTGTQEYPSLRTHKTKLALLKKSGGTYKPTKTKSITYAGERTNENSFIGSPCPDMVYPNLEDHDYVTITLDKNTLHNVENGLSSVQDPFLRGMLWSELWQMVLSKKMSVQNYLEIVEFNGLVESDIYNLDMVLDSLNTVLSKYYPRGDSSSEDQRRIWVKFFEQAMLNKIQETLPNPETQKVWLDYLVAIAESVEVQDLFVKMLKGKGAGPQLAFDLDQDRRWDMLSNLMTFAHPQSHDLLEAETKRDPSKRGELSALRVRAQEPKLEVKQKFFDELVNERNTKSLSYLRTVMDSLFPRSQFELQKEFATRYFQVLKNIHKNTDNLFVVNFSGAMAPAFCDTESSEKMGRFIAAEKGMSFGVIKEMKEVLYENDRCKSIRQLLNQTEKPTGQH